MWPILPITMLLAMLSPERQEELCQENARFFQSKLLTSGNSAQEEIIMMEEEQKAPAKYISSNTWPRSSRGRKLKKAAARPFLRGVQIRRLDDTHLLKGQLGLFAAQPFSQFDILGDYCGVVYDGNGGSEYATFLEDRNKKYSMGVDSSVEGNELRFCNHYLGIANEANVIMKIAYVEELPRVLVVCKRDIEVGEEFLFHFSDAFVQEYCT